MTAPRGPVPPGAQLQRTFASEGGCGNLIKSGKHPGTLIECAPHFHLTIFYPRPAVPSPPASELGGRRRQSTGRSVL